MEEVGELPTMGRITRISWGRTYNTGNYTSYRVDVEYALADYEDPLETMAELAESLHQKALIVMEARGVKYIDEPNGRITLPVKEKATSDDDLDPIPF